MSKRTWILLTILLIVFASLLVFGVTQGDAGYVHQNAASNFCFS